MEDSNTINQNTEDIRAMRQARATSRAQRLRAIASGWDKKADQERAKHENFTSDYSFITQPLLVGHHSYHRMKKLRDRIGKQMDREMEYSIKAKSYRDRADRLENHVVVKGDAERRRQAKREQLDSLVTIGTRVFDAIFGEAEVVRINKKSYTLKFVSGWTCSRDKSYCRLLDTDNVSN